MCRGLRMYGLLGDGFDDTVLIGPTNIRSTPCFCQTKRANMPCSSGFARAF